jgi:pilus assembly protein CpaD
MPATFTRRNARWLRRAAPVLAATAAILLTGCASRDSITVGSVPDDYRTNHPIVVGEKQEVLDLPVALDAHRATRGQRELVDGFLYRYERGSGAPVTIMAPIGSANAPAAASVAAELAGHIRRAGVRDVSIQNYVVESAEASAPLRVTYVAIRAQTGKCGRWPADLTENSENRHWANFGCSYQNNLAAQIANPHDLIGPRRPTEIDAEKRGVAIDDYQTRVSDWAPESDY